MTSLLGVMTMIGTATTSTGAVMAQPTSPVEVVCKCEPTVAKGAVAAATADDGVIIAEGGDLGLSFRFGGLASLSLDGDTRVVSNFPITQVGLKIVSSREVHIPISFGFAFRDVADGGGRDDAVVGFDLNAGIEYYFRIWRRIAPYFGATVGLGYTDIENDALIGFGIGPVIGVQYYIADRVSLGAEYAFSFQIATLTDEAEKLINLSTSAGGQAYLTVYF